MSQLLKQSTATIIRVGPFLDSSDGYTVEAALSVPQGSIQVAPSGVAFRATTNTAGATYDTLGFYSLTLDSTDLSTLGALIIAVSTAGALPVWERYMVLPANVFDSIVSGSDYLDVATVQITASVTTGTIAAGAITSNGFAANAILSQPVASVAGAVGSVTAPVTAGTVTDKTSYTLSAGQIVTAGTVSDKTAYSLAAGQVVTAGTVSDKTGYGLAAGAITSTAIATDAIDDDALSVDAIVAIQAGLSTLTAALVEAQLAGSHGTGSWLTVTVPTVAQIEAQLAGSHGTGNWEGAGAAPTVVQIEAQLAGSHGAGSWLTGTAAPTAADIESQLAGSHGTGVWTAPTLAQIEGQLATSHGAGTWVTITAAQIESQLAGSHGTGAWETGTSLDTTGVAGAVWGALRSAHTTSGAFGQGVASVQGNVTGSVASVTGAVTTGTLQAGTITAASVSSGAFTSDGFAANAILSQAVAAVTGAVGSVTAAITAGTISDKTGYSLASGQIVTAGTVTDKTGYSLSVTPPTLAQIEGQLAGSHGTGSWADTGAAPTVAQIEAQLAGSHGTGSWADVSVSNVTATAGNQAADYTLRRSLQSAEDSTAGDTKVFRSLLGAAAKQVNKIALTDSTLTIYETDDTTALGTQTATSTTGAESITALDTA